MKHIQKLTLTKATEEDCRFLYDLRNEEDVRKNSFQTESFSYESHVAWRSLVISRRKFMF